MRYAFSPRGASFVSVISVKIFYVNILTGMVKWVAIGGGEGGVRCQLGGKGSVRRCCGMEWLIVASRHPRVLVEWIKGWKKEWKPFHAFTDQSQDHVFRAIPSPLGTRDMHHPAIHFYFPDLCVCSCRCRGDRICKLCAKGIPPRRRGLSIPRYDDINLRERKFYVWVKHD